MTAEVEIEGSSYRIGALSARIQFHVLRRLAPAIGNLGPLLVAIQPSADGKITLDGDELVAAVGALIDAVSRMSDPDVDFVLDQCLDVVRRRNPQGQWVPIRTPGGRGVMQFQDLENVPMQLRLVFEVLRDNLSSFSFAPLASLFPTTEDSTSESS